MACEHQAASESVIQLSTLSLAHPWVQASYNGSISSDSHCTRSFTEAEHLRVYWNIPGGTPTLADMFRETYPLANMFPRNIFVSEQIRYDTGEKNGESTSDKLTAVDVLL